jgi:tRNA G18 (ribose-2'-O)-methylase SpoU
VAASIQLVTVDDATDPRLAAYRDLRDPASVARQGLFVAESRRVVRRLLGSRLRTRSVLLTASALESLRADLLRLTTPPPVIVAAPPVLREIVGFDFHRGCLALGERPAPLGVETLSAPPGARVLVALEGVANPDNVGGVFRNASAFGAAAVLLSLGCADPLYRRTIRVGIGAPLVVPFAVSAEWPATLARLRADGYTLVALSPDGPEDLATLRPPARLALLLGHEGRGLSPASLAAAGVGARIAMVRGVDSLNVASASAIALHRLTGAR